MFVSRNPVFRKAKTDLRNLAIGKTWLLFYCYRRHGEMYTDFFCKFQELESFIDHLTDIPQITIKNRTLPRNPFHRLFPHSNKEQTLIYCYISSCYPTIFHALVNKGSEGDSQSFRICWTSKTWAKEENNKPGALSLKIVLNDISGRTNSIYSATPHEPSLHRSVCGQLIMLEDGA